MLTQLVKLAIQEIADPDDIVVLTNISAGVDGASFFGITEESPDPLTIEDGQTVQQRFRHTINMRGLYDSADMTKLRTWSAAQVPVRITGYGVDGAAIWEGTYLISPSTGYDSVNVTALQVTVEWLGAFASGFRQIHIGQNLLRNYDTNAGDGTKLSGFTVGAGITASEAGGAQTLTRASSTGTYLASASIFFPFEGLTLTASINITAANSQNGEFGFRFLDDTGATISDSVDAIDSVSRISHSATVPAGTFFVRLIVNPSDTVADSVTFDEPMLAIGTNATYTDW